MLVLFSGLQCSCLAKQWLCTGQTDRLTYWWTRLIAYLYFKHKYWVMLCALTMQLVCAATRNTSVTDNLVQSLSIFLVSQLLAKLSAQYSCSRHWQLVTVPIYHRSVWYTWGHMVIYQCIATCVTRRGGTQLGHIIHSYYIFVWCLPCLR